MKIEDGANNRLIPFSSVQLGEVFRYKKEVAIKVYPLETLYGSTVKAISLEDGRHYGTAFNDESTLVEPLDHLATLVIK